MHEQKLLIMAILVTFSFLLLNLDIIGCFPILK